MMINYVFLGFLISKKRANQLFMHDKYPNIQTYKFINKFVQSLELKNKSNIAYISAQPTSLYPKNKKIFFKKEKYTIQIHEKIIDVSEISFINFSFLRIVTRFISSFFALYRILHKNRDSRMGIIVYSVHLPFMLSGVLLSKLFKIQLISLWTDPPAVFSSGNILVKLVRKIEQYISKFLMRKADKVIALTKYLAEDFAPGKPNLVIEGFIDNYENYSFLSKKELTSNESIIVTYSGSIVKNYGLRELIEAVADLDDDNKIVLNIYGRGEYEDELRKISQKLKRINYFGYLNYLEIARVHAQSDYLINTRSNNEYFSKYSFPSKILEYMMSGRPVVSTFLDGMPEEYKNYLIIINDNDPRTIKNKLIEISSLTLDERNAIGEKARIFALTKSIQSQSEKIAKFIWLS